MEYNEQTCVTAAELRSNGIPVPENIPDVAWIRRCDIRITQDKTQDKSCVKDNDEFSIKLNVIFTAPFNWFKVTVITENRDNF
jgi:hypothetical protein